NNLQTLAVTIEARTRGLEKALQRVEKQTSGALGKVERDAKRHMSGLERAMQNADRRMAGFGKSLVPQLGAIAGALSIREVARYADAWTRAKNSLAVAGVTGQQQVKVLDQLYQAAQRN